ncbi:hypothetical protein CEXT_463131 [Caerostris extrusa]|uniref:Uncharacterized protein n=1 Tax=Caerostris extrusa TaxID=172846 RepID=A0AAV4NXC5_CAEEX|nr:hypothetical protein CEXT_463131 [Caerostris extrusa]
MNGSLNTPITVTQEWLGSIQIYGLTGEHEVRKTSFNFVSCSLSYEMHSIICKIQIPGICKWPLLCCNHSSRQPPHYILNLGIL